eukprot:SAG11_NODE_5420_length_1565_cov_1.590723_1_plen_123_part_00
MQSSSTMSHDANAEDARALDALEAMAQGVVESLQQIDDLTANFAESKQPQLHGQLQGLVTKLSELHDSHVPENLMVSMLHILYYVMRALCDRKFCHKTLGDRCHLVCWTTWTKARTQMFSGG